MGVFSRTDVRVGMKNQEKLTQCGESLARLRRAVSRIERTVNPQAVLERLRLSADRKEAILDEARYVAVPRRWCR